MKNNSNRLAVKMLISMVAGIIVGLIFMAIRESLGVSSAAWQTINNWLFQDITAKAPKGPWACSTSAVSSLSNPSSW